MPSLRQRVSSYIRQLSFHNEPREKRHNINENAFITKYLQGQIKLREGPPVMSGKQPTDLPNYDIGMYTTGKESIIGCYTGPHGGLTTVKRAEKHLSMTDSDIDFIDTQEENAPKTVETPPLKKIPSSPIDNTTMVIKVAGQEYFVTGGKKRVKSQSAGSLNDLNPELEIGREENVKLRRDVKERSKCTNSNPHKERQVDVKKANRRSGRNRSQNQIDDRKHVKKDNKSENYIPLSKSKSEGNPFQHRKQGKIIKLQQRPTSTATTGFPSAQDASLPDEWRRHSEHVYGMSDSLYDKNQITKVKNGDPIADCFGIIARKDSAILAVADGVNWGEKACVAAKSAVHGCLHYLDKTIFNDTEPFDGLVKGKTKEARCDASVQESRVTNTREVLVCLLRAFNCAHDLILENEGMLTTLTVAVVLPLKQGGGDEENYACCVCNVGDTLAYVYSHRYGMRELTKGSHDIQTDRDMRDALGALGPVDGTNPELSNLTLSVTKVQKGDIVLLASDGLTDNFDSNVCKFTVNSATLTDSLRATTRKEPKRKSAVAAPPVKPPRRNPGGKKRDSDVVDRASIGGKGISKTMQIVNNLQLNNNLENRDGNSNPADCPTSSKPQTSTSEAPTDNPLIAQFLRENALEKPIRSYTKQLSVPSSNTLHSVPKEQKYQFLRSKTSLDLRVKPIQRNGDGIPYVTPIQRYELTLLLMEDILRHGISGRDSHCVTAKKLCENLMRFTFSITAAKRRTLEDSDLYYDNQNGLLTEVSAQERKLRRKKVLERVQNLPGKLDHVTVVAFNVGDHSPMGV